MAVADPATIERLVERFRTRLRWRHVWVITLATLMVLTGLGALLSLWVPDPKHHFHRIGTEATRPALTVVFGAVYVAGAALMSYGLSRFETRRAVRRFPLLLALSLLVLAVLMVFG